MEQRIHTVADSSHGRVARAEVTIAAEPDAVWRGLTDPAMVRQYMAGATIESDWKVGSPIQWRGEWKGKAFKDKGTVLVHDRPRRLAFTHFSPSTGDPDVPESYHRVVIELDAEPDGVHVVLQQDNNRSEDARQHSEANWKMMLSGLKKVVEGGSAA